MDKREIEQRIAAGGPEASRLKRQLFDIEVQRTKESVSKASSESDAARHSKLGNYMLNKYNKYNGSSYKN